MSDTLKSVNSEVEKARKKVMNCVQKIKDLDVKIQELKGKAEEAIAEGSPESSSLTDKLVRLERERTLTLSAKDSLQMKVSRATRKARKFRSGLIAERGYDYIEKNIIPAVLEEVKKVLAWEQNKRQIQVGAPVDEQIPDTYTQAYGSLRGMDNPTAIAYMLVQKAERARALVSNEYE